MTEIRTAVATPGFLTNRELDRLSRRRTRERWQAKGLLGEPLWARADRRKVALYPELVLTRFVIGVSGEPEEEGVLARVGACVDGLARSAAFEAVADAVALVMRRGTEIDLRTLAAGAAEAAPGALEEYHGLLLAATEELAADGVVLAPELGRVVSIGRTGCVLALGEIERSYPLRDAVSDLIVGERIVVDHVGVLGRERDFLVPALGEETTTRTTEGVAMTELDWSEVSEADWEGAIVAARASAAQHDDTDYWQDSDEPVPRAAPVTLADLRARRAATV